jgi:putative flippase GtrA
MNHVQFVRFVSVGLGLNATLYAAYLILNRLGVGHEVAMTITFCLGTLLSFISNRNLTFRHRGDYRVALLRFLECYAMLYTINFVALWVLAGRMGIAHQIVQGGVVLVFIPLVFVLQRYWVFRPAPGRMVRVTGMTER